MGRTNRERRGGHRKTQFPNCYKGHEPNDDVDVVISKGKLYFPYSWAMLHTKLTWC